MTSEEVVVFLDRHGADAFRAIGDPEAAPLGPAAAIVRDHLRRTGASFLADLVQPATQVLHAQRTVETHERAPAAQDELSAVRVAGEGDEGVGR